MPSPTGRPEKMNKSAPILRQSASAYFQQLADLMLSVEVTDQQGVSVSLEEAANGAAELIGSVKSVLGKVMVIGNGGSASIASHMQNDLCKALGVRAMVFNEPPLLMALSNDIGYECVFERPIELWADAGDVLFAISSSGQSANILLGVEAARRHDCRIVTLSGFSPGNPLRGLGDLNFYVSSGAYGHVELTHGAITHFFTDHAAQALKAAGDSQV